MARWCRLTVGVLLALQTINAVFLRLCNGAAPSGDEHLYDDPDYGDYYKDKGEKTYNYNGNEKQSVDYNNYGVVEETTVLCYTCEYTLHEDGDIEGYDNCKEPFNKVDIPSIQCKGPCAKRYEIMGPTTYSVRRSCLPNCKDRTVKDRHYVRCCSTNLCNGQTTLYNALRDPQHLLLTVIAVLTAAAAAALRRL